VARARVIVKDHVKPLKCGGSDAVSNMHWQTRAEAKAKDKLGNEGLCSLGVEAYRDCFPSDMTGELDQY
jgi:hypothetical protein